MRKQGTVAPFLAIAVVVAVSLNVIEGSEDRRKRALEVPGIDLKQTATAAPLGPMPDLDPISRFVPPIDPWAPGGFGWQVEGLDDQGDPLCATNWHTTPTCDPDGPRAFLHAGFDAAPAPDRVVRASAAGRVVVARHTTAFVTGLSEAEGGGIVALEHDRDGDPSTGDDRLLTIYGHVVPEVAVGQIVAEGERIALTSTERGTHLHFGVRQGPFDPAALDLFRSFLPPPGTSGCAGCHSRPLPAPAFPDLWQNPEQIFASPASYWLAIYGEPSDSASDVLETDDGYMAFGSTPTEASPGSMAVRRLDREGNIVSQHAYYTPGIDSIKHVERTQDGGVIALAVSLTGVQVPMLVKFDAAGEPQWARRYGVEAAPGFPPVRMWWEDLAVTADGGYIVTGTIRLFGTALASVAVARLDATGNVLWVRTYGPLFPIIGQRAADGTGIAPAADGGFVVVAEYQVATNLAPLIAKDLMVFRIDAAGEVLWGTNLGNGLNDARAAEIEATPDGGSIVVGYRTLASYVLPSEIWVVKMNGDGTIAWNSLYGSASGNGLLEESGTALAVTGDGGYVVAGHRTSLFSEPSGPDTDLVVMRLDGAGEIVGQRRLDSLGERTTPLALRAIADGFILAGGAECNSRTCQFFPEGSARFVVAHLDGELDCPGQCTDPYDLVRHPRSPTGAVVGFNVAALTGTWVDTQLARVDATGRRHPCEGGFFGAPPAFDPASFTAGRHAVSCDRTQYIEALVCSLGVPGVRATSPVVLNVSYDALSLTAHVVDADSTPEQSDVASVAALLFVEQPPDPRSAVPVLDDGSLSTLPSMFFSDVMVCQEDPFAGVCSCTHQIAPAFSGDLVMGDGIHTLETSLTLPLASLTTFDLGKGCVLENRPLSTAAFSFSPGSPVSVVLLATDRVGNVTGSTGTITTSAATMTCSGDACGCCLLVSDNPSECSGLLGMTSPDFPDGICRSF